MTRGVNKVILIGNLGSDPKMRSMEGRGQLIANFSVATSESYRDKSGQNVERTEWHRVVCYGKLAEIVQKYVKKGGRVYIEGKLKTAKWKDKNGVERESVDIVCNELQMLGARPDDGSVPTNTLPEYLAMPDDEIPF